MLVLKAQGEIGNIALRTSMLLHITEPEVNDCLDVNIPAPLAAHDMFGYCHFTAIFHSTNGKLFLFITKHLDEAKQTPPTSRKNAIKRTSGPRVYLKVTSPGNLNI